MHAAPRAPARRATAISPSYVSNIAWEAGWQDLKDHFKQFGRVVFVDIARDAQTGKSMGRGIVRFDDADSAARAVQFGNGSIFFMGRDLNVREDRMMAQQQLQVQLPLPPMQLRGVAAAAASGRGGSGRRVAPCIFTNRNSTASRLFTRHTARPRSRYRWTKLTRLVPVRPSNRNYCRHHRHTYPNAPRAEERSGCWRWAARRA